MKRDARVRQGIAAALYSALFLGMTPIFGKLALEYGFQPAALIAVRSSIAALLMLVLMALRMRPFFYIYPVGLVGCILAGVVNGLGSILYYAALARLNAGVGHMIYSAYPVFLALWLLLERQKMSHITWLRLGLALPAVLLLLNNGGSGAIDQVGALMMVGSAALYALHLMINQRILYEAPAPTVTLYTLLAMAATVIAAYFLGGASLPAPQTPWWPVLAMAFLTFVSRFSLFAGVKHLGGLQTALLGLAELIVTVTVSQVWLGERLSLAQWAGAGLLMISLALVGFEKITPQRKTGGGWLSWLNPSMRSNY